mmetsp:Transcript_45384/g.79919  ORF Transcript_45384/g.79919 Transcript_45384/m.79919 type:complete len:238 (-) Transcript_45384:297-1010(-)
METPRTAKKTRVCSLEKSSHEDVPTWALGAIRILQRDMNNILPVVNSLAQRLKSVEKNVENVNLEERIFALEQTCALEGKRFADFLMLPQFVPSVNNETHASLDTKFDNLLSEAGGFKNELTCISCRLDDSMCSLETKFSSLKAFVENQYNAAGDISSIFQRLGVLDDKVASLRTAECNERAPAIASEEFPNRFKLLDDQVTRIFDITDSLDRGLTALGEDFERLKLSRTNNNFSRW